ncbi:hypothetical protein HSX37_16280|uniref:Uncharacterized protein n=1 Tax=Dendrosporobacter quercicolus TaxID=146817 RepID=A0A1G9ZRB4_9FIRM|nr:hypothetical protein [Dendrosporobacter quercicolus]NSL49594.1 hypothetical protein [Dendrosporobacter quercicolus DSM 1736]SDN24132.1 hypothetical protein SAMN04488502_11550 [Dendrosporobacter quercicolus]
MKNLKQLLEEWKQALQIEFSPEPETIIQHGNQMLLANQIILALQAENASLKNIINLRRKENVETMEPWLAQYGIPYTCGWRDAIDELIAGGTAADEDIITKIINAINAAGIKYRLEPEGVFSFQNEDDKTAVERIIAEIEAEAEPAVPRCQICGCTDNHACPGGCYWVRPDLCSACLGVGK